MDRRSQENFNFVKHTSTIFIPDSFIKIGGINSVAGNICVGKHWKKHGISAQSVTPQFHLLSAFAPVLSATLLWWSNSGYVYENASTQCPEIHLWPLYTAKTTNHRTAPCSRVTAIHVCDPEPGFHVGLTIPSGKSEIVHYCSPPEHAGCCTIVKLQNLTAQQWQATPMNVFVLAVEHQDWSVFLQ